jgi:DNA-binding transcriptional regulator YiaG
MCELRQKSCLSQREFATFMDISPGTLRNWEQILLAPLC